MPKSFFVIELDKLIRYLEYSLSYEQMVREWWLPTLLPSPLSLYRMVQLTYNTKKIGNQKGYTYGHFFVFLELKTGPTKKSRAQLLLISSTGATQTCSL